VRPDVSPALARALSRDAFGVDGEVRELGSQQDRNFLVDGPSGRFVLKVANPGFSDDEVDVQDAALRHLGGRLPGLAVPEPRAALDGARVVHFAEGGTPLRARLLTFVDGFPLSECRYLAPVVVESLGTVAGAVAAGLAGLGHPGLDRALQWDARRAREVCHLLAPYVRDPGRRDAVLRAVTRACDLLDALAPELRVAPVHGDVTDDNVVCGRQPDGRARPVGVIDFGDVGLGWVVGDLAATCTSVLHHDPSRPLAVLPAVRGFDRRLPLEQQEMAALWAAVVARSAVLVVSGQHQGAIDPGNDYAVAAQEREWSMFAAAAALPVEVATAAVRDALGRPAPDLPVPAGRLMLPGLRAAGDLPVLDLSVGTDDLRHGEWLAADAELRVAGRALEQAPAAVTRYAEARLTRTRSDSREPPPTVALCVEVFCSAPTAVCAPFDGTVTRVGDRLSVLAGAHGDLLLRHEPAGAALASGPVAAGDVLLADITQVGIQLSTVPGLLPPPFVRPDEAVAWRAVSPDPSGVLGLVVQDRADPAPSAAALLDRRRDALAGVQGHYYDVPPQIERGWRHHLVDTGARTYLDGVNNVTGVGHAHPRITRAAARQWDLLNTNSRFHYRALADFSARLAGLLPDPLDTVFLVNSGSEAVDLALRLARTYTGREDVFCVAEAYHGWTLASDAVSTSVADNPEALTTRPDWVHPLSAPNSYRGRFRGPDAGPRYVADARRVLREAVDAGRAPAAFLCEALYGNAGGVALPDGYLAGVYEAVRGVGGLCLADEVQVGYGRLGRWFWGFEQQGVVPDIVTVAKAMGNGHPLGAVITSRGVAERFAGSGYFFSSSGGSPVSCAVGMAVLDVMADEGLQANAVEVGAHLRECFERLAREVPMIGAVHGCGLYLGVELVRDRETLEPASEETTAICERLLEMGVVMQPTGDHLNVLKIKPPLCITRESADFFADALAEVFRSGW
jgi:4-aminobutyrate aminotransferase-like enzyme/Ser/Thr protein kinase RdoA (MazF antagonist)